MFATGGVCGIRCGQGCGHLLPGTLALRCCTTYVRDSLGAVSAESERWFEDGDLAHLGFPSLASCDKHHHGENAIRLKAYALCMYDLLSADEGKGMLNAHWVTSKIAKSELRRSKKEKQKEVYDVQKDKKNA